MRKLGRATKANIAAVIAAHRAELEQVRGFVDAEPGFRIANGWVRREPAIVLYLDGKRPASELPREDMAPRAIGGYPVDVLTADPLRLLARDGDGDVLSDATLAALTYARRRGNPIDAEFEIDRPITCHLGPDAGWPVLKRFLEATRETLTAAMYDLNADYIANTLVETVRDNDVKFVLTWDSGMTGEEPALRADLKAKLSERLDAWLVRTGGGYRFDSAYHEKVAVQDSRSFWLSSGNWSTRSQPDIDPIADPSLARGMYSKGNREWHIVVENPPLAKLFEAYIRYDRDQSEGEATAMLTGSQPAMPDLFVPIDLGPGESDFALAAVQPVAAERLPTHGRAFRVRPVLCPDNYIKRIVPLIKSARHSLYLQFSYISYSDAARDAPFRRMLDYIGALSHRSDFDLRIIVGNNAAQEKVRKLVEAGYNENRIRVQSNVHNKGIIVDGETVLVSSANWSSAGTLRNRDAGLVIYEPEIARYYQKAFIDDWEQRARSDFGRDRPVRIAAPNEPTPPGMARMRWNDFVQG